MTISELDIISLNDFPVYKEPIINYVNEHWNVVIKPFTYVVNQCFSKSGFLPQTYIMVKHDEIIGFYQLVEQELLIRKDLSPWITCVFIDENQRGNRFSARLLEHGRTIAGSLGFQKVYLTTNHIQFYEKFGFREIGLSNFINGSPSKIYEHDTIK
ncbi:MAG: GNAT family N-acetyltransferase [Dehalococcoidales bacterium]|nr:GNAT family N-acetyltransferase [Dehalococcoidales bacterium]